MNEISMEVLNRRTTVATVHAEAARIGADADALLDSKTFYDQVTSLDPDAPGYRKQVEQLVTTAAERSPASTRTPAQSPASPAGPRQWTLADIDKASRAELEEAMNAGLLVDLGVGVPKRRPWQHR
jgi:hypothetical protein